MAEQENVLNREDPRDSQGAMEQVRKRLIDLFGNMDHEVPLLLFTDPFSNSQYCDAVRAIIREVRELSNKVTLREYDLNHQLAKQHHATHSPTLLFDPEHFSIHWLEIGRESCRERV